MVTEKKIQSLKRKSLTFLLKITPVCPNIALKMEEGILQQQRLETGKKIKL